MTRQKQGPQRYAAYLRCSSDDQKHGDYTTVDTQRELNTRHIGSLGGELVGEYADEGKTGTNLNRPEWKRLLKDGQEGRFDAVVVTYMSRLGRGSAFTIAEYELQKAGISVLTVREQFTDDLAGYIGKTTTIMMDGLYPKMVSQWTRTKMQAMVEKGYVCGGTTPFGYRREPVPGMASGPDGKDPPKRLVIHPEEAPFVLRAFQLYAETGSAQQVRHYLNAVTVRDWTIDTATYLLKNEVYRGVLVFGQWRNEAAHEAVVPPALWDAAQARTQKPLRAPKHDPKDKTGFYLRGVVHCAHCGSRMTPANHHGRTAAVRYYECIINTKRRAVCPVKRINAGSLHEAVLDHIRRAAEHPTRMTELIGSAVKEMPAAETPADQGIVLARRLRDVEKRSKAILNAIEGGGAGLKTLLTRLAELQAQEQTLKLEQMEAERQVQEAKLARPDAGYVQKLWKRFLILWEAATEKEKTMLLPLLVERVELTKKERGIVRLSFSAGDPRSDHFATSNYVASESRMGAGDRLSSIYSPEPLAFETVSFRFKTLKGGRCRTKIPRPERQLRPG